MPENETLICDSRNASRWRPIAERLECGQPPSELFAEIQDQFYSALRKVWKQWRARGVDAGQLFDAALTDEQLLNDLIKQTWNDPNARLLREVAGELQDANMERLIRGFVDAAWENVEIQLQLDQREEARSLEFIRHVQRMLSRIVGDLLSNPSRFPNRPSRNEPPPDLDTRLREDLL
jgi:hypothetical protein